MPRAESSPKHAPVPWLFKSRKQSFGLYVDDRGCWLGDEGGNVYAVDHKGKLKGRLRLAHAVKALVGDGQWLYAASEGRVFDLGGRTPRLAYTVESDIEVLWMDISFGTLFVSDQAGDLAVFDHEGDELWRKRSPGDTAWMIRADGAAAFHGFDRGVAAYARDTGKRLWRAKVKGCTFFGAQTAKAVYACTNANWIHAFDKRTGRQLAAMECESTVNACVATEDGARIYAADDELALYAFDKKGKRLWKLSLPDSLLSMQLHDGLLYGATWKGGLMCVDVSEAAIAKALKGAAVKTRVANAPAGAGKVARTDALEKASARDLKKGVLLECVKEGSRLRVKVASPGYHADWHVQFPRDIRKAGAHFVVDRVEEAGRGNFYRTVGEIRRAR